MKQETPEEAAEYYSHNYFDMHETNNYKALKQGFINGAKWQQQQMYSEEELKEMVYHMVGELAKYNNMTFNGAILDEWFKQFKKKQHETN